MALVLMVKHISMQLNSMCYGLIVITLVIVRLLVLSTRVERILHFASRSVMMSWCDRVWILFVDMVG